MVRRVLITVCGLLLTAGALRAADAAKLAAVTAKARSALEGLVAKRAAGSAQEPQLSRLIAYLEKARAKGYDAPEMRALHAGALVERGRNENGEGRFPDAIATLEKALSLAPDSARAHLELAVAYERAGKPGTADQVSAHGAQALRLDPTLKPEHQQRLTGGTAAILVAAAHRPTGFGFPDPIPGYTFTGYHAYDPQENDVSGGYNAPDAAITVYIYPAPPGQSLEQQADEVGQEIAQVNASAKVTETGPITIRPGGKAISGLRRAFDVELKDERKERAAEAFPDGHQPSYLYLFSLPGWWVKARVTPAGPPAADLPARVVKLLEQLRWP